MIAPQRGSSYADAMATLTLGKRTLFSLTGNDAVRYLNGQVTQDVRRLLTDPARALATCVTDAKGRLQALATLYLIDPQKPEILIESAPVLREMLYARLGRYLIADDAELADVSDEWILLHHLGHAPTGQSYAYPRLGIAGFDQWVPADVVVSLEDELTQLESEKIRIEHGVPAWDVDLQPGMLPQEAGLEELTLSFQKGCYIGQEVISRIKSAGKLNRILRKFHLRNDQVVKGGELLSFAGQDVVGTLTSVAYPHALGFLQKKGFGQKTFDLRLSDGSILAQAVDIAEG